jgi:hypothetical protein
MGNERSLKLFLEELKALIQKEKQEEEAVRLNAENKFLLFCDELKTLYEEEQKNSYISYIAPFLENYSFLNQKSSLQVIKKNSHETYHSLYLKYIWNWRNSSYASSLLCDFVDSIEDLPNKDLLKASIPKQKYSIEEEHPIKKAIKRSLNGMRIDLLITDSENKWCIVLENKINSSVSFDKKRNRSQLDCYRLYCEDKKEYKDYSKVYILISHKENKKYCDKHWMYVDYYHIFHLFLSCYEKDDIIKDYLKTLFFLLFPNIQIAGHSKMSLNNIYSFYKHTILKINI